VLTTSEEDKARGNRLFQEGQYRKSFEAYKKGAEALETCLPPQAMTAEVRKLLVALYCNGSQASLKCTDDADASTNGACTMAEKALALEPKNVKALFRRGCAYANAEDWAMACDDFNRALELDPGNDAVLRELAKVHEKLGKSDSLPQKNNATSQSEPYAEAMLSASKEKDRGAAFFSKW